MAYSKIPLRVSFYIGMLSGLLSLLLILHVIYCNIMGKAVPGWTTTMIVDCLFSGFQLIFIGVIGEYIGRIFEEVKHRPLYWLRAELGQHKDR